MITRTISTLITILLFLSSCMKEEQLWDFEKQQLNKPYKGLFIVNEGNFMYGNASLSYYDLKTREVFNNVFYETNALPLGDVAQSMSIRDSLGYIVMNNSGKIMVINLNTFTFAGKITGLTSPRYMHFISDTKAYVTDLYARAITIVNPQTLEITGSIDISNTGSEFPQHSADQMVQYGKYVFTNCWSHDNKILVIDSEFDKLIDSVEVIIQPTSLVIDKHDQIWALCDGGFQGNPYGHERPGLMRIDAKSLETDTIALFDKADQPTGMAINGSKDTIYYINQHVYRRSVLPGSESELFIESPYKEGFSGGFYSLEVDPASSEVYVSDAIDYVQNGVVYRYQPDGMALDTFKVGITPGSFCFKPAKK